MHTEPSLSCAGAAFFTEKKMKKVYTILLLALLGTFALGGTAFAASEYVEQLTPDSADYAEVSTLTNRVLDAMSGMCADVTAADIDWSQAYKVYADESDVYSSYKEQQMTYDEIKQQMECYVWVLPVQVKDAYFHVTISQGMPLTEDESVLAVLTEEQKEQIREETGKWIPVVTEQLDEDKTAEQIDQQITDAVGEETIYRAFIMGGSPKLRSAVAVVETIDHDIQIVVLEEPRLTGVKSSEGARTTERPLESDQAYAMEDMADRMSEYTVDKTDEQTGAGGENSAGYMTVLWIVLGAAGIEIGCWAWKRARCK